MSGVVLCCVVWCGVFYCFVLFCVVLCCVVLCCVLCGADGLTACEITSEGYNRHKASFLNVLFLFSSLNHVMSISAECHYLSINI